MAETRSSFRFARRYPWDEWANGDIWTLTRTTFNEDGSVAVQGDFDVVVKSFRGAAWLHARDAKPPLNLRTSVHIEYKTDENGDQVLGEDGKPIVEKEQVTVHFTPKTDEQLNALGWTKSETGVWLPPVEVTPEAAQG